MTHRKNIFLKIIMIVFVIGSTLLNIILFSKMGSNVMFMSALIFLWIGLGFAVLYCILSFVSYMIKGREDDLY